MLLNKKVLSVVYFFVVEVKVFLRLRGGGCASGLSEIFACFPKFCCLFSRAEEAGARHPLRQQGAGGGQGQAGHISRPAGLSLNN